jgi:hypothetical protein
MITIIPPNRAKELDQALKHQRDCKKNFQDTAQRVNGYLKQQVEKLPKEGKSGRSDS